MEEKSTNLNKLTRLDFYYRADFTRLIQELRTNRGGSLSGMTLDEIVSQITILVHDFERQQGRSPSVAATQPQVSTLRNYLEGSKHHQKPQGGNSRLHLFCLLVLFNGEKFVQHLGSYNFSCTCNGRLDS